MTSGATRRVSGISGCRLPFGSTRTNLFAESKLDRSSVIPLIEQNRNALVRLCRQFRVERLELFGSAAKGTFQPEASDVDFLVTFADAQPGTYADRYLGLLLALQELLQKEIDLVTERSIRNPYFRKAVDATRQLIYDGRGEEALA